MRSLSSVLSVLKQYRFSDRLDHPEAFTSIVSGNKNMRAVHDLSGCSGAFVALNVAGLDDSMFSDTLFGHCKGAFTGTDQACDGLITRAAGGALLLDENGDLNEMSQIKLLRLLQELEYYPVGSDFIKKSSARMVLATNRDLLEQIKQGRFRNDLYYRLCGHRVHRPPLRERLDDILLLLGHFLAASARFLNKKKRTPRPVLAVRLALYGFPGKVRELETLLFDAVLWHRAGILSMESFRAVAGVGRRAVPFGGSQRLAGENALCAIFGHFPTIDEVEAHLIREAMALAKGNQGLASKILGMGRQPLNKRLKG